MASEKRRSRARSLNVGDRVRAKTTGRVGEVTQVTQDGGRESLTVAYDRQPQDEYLTTPARDGAEVAAVLHDEDHGLGRGAQPIEHRASGGAERFVTLMAAEALLLPRMDTDIALAAVASSMTVPIGAECGCGVHDGPPGVV